MGEAVVFAQHQDFAAALGQAADRFGEQRQFNIGNLARLKRSFHPEGPK